MPRRQAQSLPEGHVAAVGYPSARGTTELTRAEVWNQAAMVREDSFLQQGGGGTGGLFDTAGLFDIQASWRQFPAVGAGGCMLMAAYLKLERFFFLDGCLAAEHIQFAINHWPAGKRHHTTVPGHKTKEPKNQPTKTVKQYSLPNHADGEVGPRRQQGRSGGKGCAHRPLV